MQTLLVENPIDREAERLKVEESLNSVIKKIIAPPPDLKVSELAEKERVVAPKSSSRPGPWRNTVTPYLVEIMDCYNDPFVEVVVVMKASRMGVTEVINNIHLYTVKIDPCSNLYVQQTIQEGQKYSKKIYQPLVDYTPAMRAAVYESKAHDKNNTIL